MLEVNAQGESSLSTTTTYRRLRLSSFVFNINNIDIFTWPHSSTANTIETFTWIIQMRRDEHTHTSIVYQFTSLLGLLAILNNLLAPNSPVLFLRLETNLFLTNVIICNLRILPLWMCGDGVFVSVGRLESKTNIFEEGPFGA